MLLDKFKVSGVPSSIVVDSETNKIFVGYYDNPEVSIFDLKTKLELNSIKTKVTSAYANLIAINKEYIFTLSTAKTIGFFRKTDASLAKEIDLSLFPCGAVTSVNLSEDNLLVITTNKAIGNRNTRKNIFIYNLVSGILIANDTDIYIKATVVTKNNLFVFGNIFKDGRDQSIVKQFSLLKLLAGVVEPIQEVYIGREDIENGFSYISNRHDFNKVFIQTENSKKIVDIIGNNIEISENLLDEQINGFIHSSTIGNTIYKVRESQYYLNTNSKNHVDLLKLQNKIVTDAATLANNIFYFGVDKSVYMLHILDE